MKKQSAEQPTLPMKDITPPKIKGGNPNLVIEPKRPAAKPNAVAPQRRKPSTAVAVAKDNAPVRNMLQIVANAAADPNVNPDKMRQILDIQMTMMKEEARLAFNEAFHAMQMEMPIIDQKGAINIPAKDGKRAQSTPYAKFNDIHTAVRPVLQKHGFTISFTTEGNADNSRLLVKGVLRHVKGHEETTTLPLPLETSGSKNNVQGVGSSMSYGKRYAMIALLNIVSAAPEDADNDGMGDELKVSAKHIAEIRAALKAKNCPEASIIKWIAGGVPGLKTLEELPLAMLDDTLRAISDYRPGGAR